MLSQKKYFRGALINRKLTGKSILKIKVTILKKINISFIANFCLGKHSFSLDTFWTHLVRLRGSERMWKYAYT